MPANVTVASGQSSATFTATSGAVSGSQSAIVTATLSGPEPAGDHQPAAAAAQFSSLICSPATVNGPGTSTCTANLEPRPLPAPPAWRCEQQLNVTVPGSVNIGSGLSSATFTATVAAVTSNQIGYLTASLNGGSQTFTLGDQARQ